MGFRDLVFELVAETLSSTVPSWLEADYVTEDGSIGKNILLQALNNWVEARMSSKHHDEYIELIELISTDDEAWNSFIYLVSQSWTPDPYSEDRFNWELNISDIWYYYGFAIKKIVGNRAKPISIGELIDYHFHDENIVKTVEQKTALTRCIAGYSWDLNKYTKENCAPLRDLLPKMKSKKARVRKKYIYKAKRNANIIIQQYTLAINGRNGVRRFGGGTKHVPEQFAIYSSVVNYIINSDNKSRKKKEAKKKKKLLQLSSKQRKKEKRSHRHQNR